MLFGIEKNHPEHVAYYSFLILENLLNRFDLSIKECYYTKSSTVNTNIISKYAKIMLLKILPQLNSGIMVVLKINENNY